MIPWRVRGKRNRAGVQAPARCALRCASAVRLGPGVLGLVVAAPPGLVLPRRGEAPPRPGGGPCPGEWVGAGGRGGRQQTGGGGHAARRRGREQSVHERPPCESAPPPE